MELPGFRVHEKYKRITKPVVSNRARTNYSLNFHSSTSHDFKAEPPGLCRDSLLTEPRAEMLELGLWEGGCLHRLFRGLSTMSQR